MRFSARENWQSGPLGRGHRDQGCGRRMPMHHERIKAAATYFAPDLRRNHGEEPFRLLSEVGACNKADVVARKKIDIPLHRLSKCSVEGTSNREVGQIKSCNGKHACAV